jgi:glycosyltransferase involved in cell wall biosynthesis
MTPVKVLILIDRLGRGGVAQVALNVAQSLNRERFSPIVCTTRDKPTHGQDMLLKQAGVPLIELNRRSRWEFFTWRPLWRALSDTTILHCHLSGSNFWGRLWGKLFRVPIIITQEHTSANQKKWFEHIVDKLLSPISNRIISVSEYDRNLYIQMEKIPPQKIETIYVGIDIDKFTCQQSKLEARQAINLPADKQIIVMIARLDPQKNHKGLLKALTMLPAEMRATIHCLFVGSGDEETLSHEISGLGLQDTISFLGERDDIPTILWASDLLVLPSHYECLPSVISEAMAAECPIVATRVGGVPEMLEGVGWPLVEPNDTEGLAEAMAQVLQLPETEKCRITTKGKEMVIKRFSKDESIAGIERLYDSLLTSVKK